MSTVPRLKHRERQILDAANAGYEVIVSSVSRSPVETLARHGLVTFKGKRVHRTRVDLVVRSTKAGRDYPWRLRRAEAQRT